MNSTALPAAPRRASNPFGSAQFVAVDLRQYGEGHVDREMTATTIRMFPDGPPIEPGAFFDGMWITFHLLRKGRWRQAADCLERIRSRPAIPACVQKDGPLVSDCDALRIAKVVAIHLRNSNASTAASSVRQLLARGGVEECAEITGESDFHCLILREEIVDILDGVWERFQRKRTVSDLSAAIDEWLDFPRLRPKNIGTSGEAEIREELMRVGLLGPKQRAYGKRNVEHGRAGKIKAMEAKGGA